MIVFDLNRMKINAQLIENLDFQKLPGNLAHHKMLPRYRNLDLPNQLIAIDSAVLLLFFNWNNQLSICFTVRKKSLRKHAGQISFPGGRKESDETLLQTALRETYEEIGIHPENIKIIGELSSLYISVSNYMVHPIIGIMNQKPEFKINTDEVEEILIIPVESILKEGIIQTKNIQTSVGELDVPCFFIDNQMIWGATSMILAELVMLLKPDYFDREAHLGNAGSDH